MFYELQSKENQEKYKNLLSATGALSRLFSEDENPYLFYRAHENIFARCFDATNNSRSDDTADACKDKIGIGLKTWVGANIQKIAEFGKLRPTYENLNGLELIKKISEYRNERIRVTKSIHGLEQMLYHVIKRVPHKMEIYECIMDFIDIDNISLIKRGGENSNYFTDGKHTYNFSLSKNTLYMVFDSLTFFDEFEVKIIEDPYSAIVNLTSELKSEQKTPSKIYPQICLRLYTISKSTKTKTIENASGLNQWNGKRTANRYLKDGTKIHTEKQRNPNELYIPYPVEDQKRNLNFFPEDEKGNFLTFNLILPNGKTLKAKRCQSGGKGIMSDPNSDLGKWLLRDVFNLAEGVPVTYEMLEVFNIDSVIFTKISEDTFIIDFCPLGTYERFYNIESEDL